MNTIYEVIRILCLLKLFLKFLKKTIMKKILLLLVIVFANLLLFGQSSSVNIKDSIILKTSVGHDFDSTYLKDDIRYSKSDRDYPISSYNFPRTAYIGSAAVGPILIPEYDFKGVNFSIGNHDKFKNLFKKDSSSAYRPFLTLLCNSVSLDSIEVKISSRNFPDYITGQGFMKSQHCKIDYYTFIDFTGKSFAIINEMVFDLSNDGNVIILVPQVDGSLQFIQVKNHPITFDRVNEDCQNLFKNPKIKLLIDIAKKGSK
jgi:hypothetical protein